MGRKGKGVGKIEENALNTLVRIAEYLRMSLEEAAAFIKEADKNTLKGVAQVFFEGALDPRVKYFKDVQFGSILFPDYGREDLWVNFVNKGYLSFFESTEDAEKFEKSFVRRERIFISGERYTAHFFVFSSETEAMEVDELKKLICNQKLFYAGVEGILLLLYAESFNGGVNKLSSVFNSGLKLLSPSMKDDDGEGVPEFKVKFSNLNLRFNRSQSLKAEKKYLILSFRKD